VQPYHLACIQNQWYLIGFDTRRQGLRTFALTRLQKPKLTEKRFAVPADFDADKYLSGSFGVFNGADDYEVVVDFDAWAADEIRGRRWHGSQEITELPRGMLRLRLRLNSVEEAERWLLSFGTHATVVRPKVLAQRLKATGQEFVRRYSDD
jgi:proteasome accessory factor B